MDMKRSLVPPITVLSSAGGKAGTVSKICNVQITYMLIAIMYLADDYAIRHGEYFILHVREYRDWWVPVTTAWRVLTLRMEERPPIWRVAANILNKQSRTADKGWSSNLEVGRGANNYSP